MIILGISCQHDSGAAIITDGRITAAVNEERITRKKLFTGFPEKSIEEAISVANISKSNIDSVAVSTFIQVDESSWDWNKAGLVKRTVEFIVNNILLRKILSNRHFFSFFVLTGKAFYVYQRLQIMAKIRNMGIAADIEFFDHHLTHHAAAVFTSGWNECLSVSIDAQGDGMCSRVVVYKNHAFKELCGVPFFNSPAHYYGYVTHILGFIQMRHEGKVTGLAAMGDYTKTYDIFRKRIRYDSGTMTFMNDGYYVQKEIEYLTKQLSGYSREDVSAGIQRLTEDVVCQFVTDVLSRFGLKDVNLVLSGGLFANVRLNQRLAEHNDIKEIFIHPHMGDGGLAVGAAYLLLYRHNPMVEPRRLNDVYFSRDFTDDDIDKALSKYNDLNYFRSMDVEMDIARLLADKKVVARFNGRMEYGPRALCHRSIIYHTTDPTVNDWLNKRLKRSEFMPFAPVIREEKVPEYFINYEKCKYALEFMTITTYCTDKCKREAPAIVHVDGTARPQIVKKESNPSMYKVLQEYEKLTGLNVLVNTSFNMHEEPIVYTPDDAIRSFIDGDLDCMAMGSYLVFRK